MNENKKYPKISPAPNWTEIFTMRPELDPPGYAETIIWMADNPYEERKKAREENEKPKKQPKKLGRTNKKN